LRKTALVELKDMQDRKSRTEKCRLMDKKMKNIFLKDVDIWIPLYIFALHSGNDREKH
jgi:hypothetical protein